MESHDARRSEWKALCASEGDNAIGLDHEQSALTSAQRGPVNATAGSETRNRFRVLRLLPFDDHQIKEYLKANVPGLAVERAFEIINTVHNLRDLAGRPYCLSLMRASLADLDRSLAAGKRVRSIDLYRNLVRLWLERDSGKHRIEQDDKPRLMARLAAWMWRESAKSLSAERLSQWLKETVLKDSVLTALYASAFTDAKRRDELLQDFRTATFIARWDGDTFRFAHTSLQEYFLAVHLVSALEEAHLDEWNLPEVNAETLDFAAELFVQRSAESASARARLEQSLNTLLGESVPQRSQNALRFYLCLHANGESRFVPAKINARGLDLIAWHLKGSKACPLPLPNADFREAKLIRAEFRDVVMREAKFNGTDLCSAELVRCDVTNADFSCGDVVPGFSPSKPRSTPDSAPTHNELPHDNSSHHRSAGGLKPETTPPRTRLEGVRFRWCQLTGTRIDGAILEGIRADLPTWDEPTEKHWCDTCAHYTPQFKIPDEVKWRPPLPTGCTSPFAMSHKIVWSIGSDSHASASATSPDHHWVVSLSRDGVCRMWDQYSGGLLYQVETGTKAGQELVFSCDGYQIGFVESDRATIKEVWEPEKVSSTTGCCESTVAVNAPGENELPSFTSLISINKIDGDRITYSCGFSLSELGIDQPIRIWPDRSDWFDPATATDGHLLLRRAITWKSLNIGDDTLYEYHSLDEANPPLAQALQGLSASSVIEGKVSDCGSLHIAAPDGTELDIAALPDDGYIILRKRAGEKWRLAKAKGDYWRYVNCYVDGPNGRTLYSVGEPEDGTVE